jgi:hypothetical protein
MSQSKPSQKQTRKQANIKGSAGIKTLNELFSRLADRADDREHGD